MHFSNYDNSLIFGSEIKTLFAYGIPRKPNLELLEIYMVLSYIPAPFTFFKETFKLDAGQYPIVRGNDVKKLKYWDLPDIDENQMNTDEGKINENFQELLNDSVKLRMKAMFPMVHFWVADSTPPQLLH